MSSDVSSTPVIDISDLVVDFEGLRVIDGLDLRIMPGETIGLIGASGSGKTVLLRTMLGLLRKSRGTIDILGVRFDHAMDETAHAVGQRCGVLFQQGALFSSLTVRENVEFPMREYLTGSNRMFREVALAKLQMVGLSPADAEKYPAQLSGGMTKRVALARALALDPEILLLDEPTSGLDPIATNDFDALVLGLRKALNLTVLMITHDLVSIRSLCTRIVALHQGRIIESGPFSAMLHSEHPWLKAYFLSEREIGAHQTR